VKSVDCHSEGDQSAKAGDISIADKKVTTSSTIETRTCMHVRQPEEPEARTQIKQVNPQFSQLPTITPSTSPAVNKTRLASGNMRGSYGNKIAILKENDQN
jgi:hypothetical protein